MPAPIRYADPASPPPAPSNWAARLGWAGKTGITEREYRLARAELVYAALILAVAAIVFCGLFPFNFGAQLGSYFTELYERFHWDFFGPYKDTRGFHLFGSLLSNIDLVQNIIFFGPFGFALGALFGHRFSKSWPKWFASLIVTTLLSFALTAFIELSQVMLASRDSSESDIITNTIGGAVGFIAYRIVGSFFLDLLATFWARIRRHVDARACAMIAFIWLVAAIVLPVWASGASSLDDWHTIYPLSLGNESNGQLHFTGQLGCLYLADRALTDAQVGRLFDGADFIAVAPPESVRAAYRFLGFGPYIDATGTSPSLDWIGGPPSPGLHDRTDRTADVTASRRWFDTLRTPILGENHWLRSAGDMSKAVAPIRNNQSFTLMLDCKTLDRYIIGPARIATISINRSARNLTIAQDDKVLVVRMNTPETGGNGTDPEFEINRVFTDPDSPHRIIVTYERPTLRIYVDTPHNRFVSTLLPETMLINHLYPRAWRYPLGQSGVELTPYIYRLCALAPLGLLIAGATVRLRHRRWAVVFIAIIAAAILDAILQLLARDAFSATRAIFAIAVCTTVAALIPPPAASASVPPASV